MIVVTVQLVSAISADRSTMLARLHIANDGEATQANWRLGDYVGESFVGRDAETLARGRVSKRGRVVGWRRHDFHVWNLVRRMLDAMGYDKGAPASAFAGLPLVDVDDGDIVSLEGLTADQKHDILEHIRGLSEIPDDTYPAPADGWTCFHCGSRFRTWRGAQLHFGKSPDRKALCLTDQSE